MATEPILAVLNVSAGSRRGLSTLSDYWALTKPEINFLIAITTAAGFWMASPATLAQFSWATFFHTLLGTVLVSSGAATLNQLFELRFDSQMRRTARRPLVSGGIEPSHAMWFGIALSLLGAMYLLLFTNALAALLSVFTLLSYLFLYTPLKRKTPLCMIVGAVPGAIPPLIGSAATGHLPLQAWILFAIVFLWQFPHFMAIAWMYREDYDRARYLVLPAGKSRSTFVTWQTLLPSLILLPVGMTPMIVGFSGPIYESVAFVTGAIFLYYSGRFAFRRTNLNARHLLLATVLYLPAILALAALSRR